MPTTRLWAPSRWPPRIWLLALLIVAASTLGEQPVAAVEELTPCPAVQGWVQLPPVQQPVTVSGRQLAGALAVAAAWEAPGSLYVGAFSGLHRSRDCGTTWQQIVAAVPGPQLRRSIPAVAVAPDGTLYVGMGHLPTQSSQDGGKSWQPAIAPSSSPYHSSVYIRSDSIAPSPSVQGLAYADSHLEDHSGFAGIARTRDGGQTWEIRASGTGGVRLAVDPSGSDVVYIVSLITGVLRRSMDGAASAGTLAQFDSRAKAVAISPDGSHLWVSTEDGGLHLTRDRGQSWEQVQDTPYEGYLSDISASPRDPRVLFAVTDGGDLWAYREPGAIDFPIPNGRFYTQTDGQGGESGLGFAVTDQNGIPFFSTFNSLPLQSIGYPISQRFTYRGFTTQVFQKLALQWQPERGIQYLNIFDELHAAGKDPWLQAVRSISPQEDTSPDDGLPWEQIVSRHLAILDRDPILREAYLSEPRWLELYGLPMGYADYPSVSVVRGQRAALQRWKVEVPWARAGEVTVANGGDIAKEAGIFPQEALLPQPPRHRPRCPDQLYHPGAPSRR